MTKQIITFSLLILFLSVSPESIFPQENNFDRIRALFDACDKQEIPGGFAATIVKDGKVIFKKAYGYANYENKIPFTTSTISDYASVAKQFTGFAVAQLIKEGRLRLNDNIRVYLPEVPDFGDTITIGHLLYHTSGIRDWVGLVKLSGRYIEDVITDDFIMKLVKNQKELNFRSGEKFQYSNTGYFLLATIISRITGKSFPEWTRETIFKPLQMNNTYFSDDYGEIIMNKSESYKKDDKGNYKSTPDNLAVYGSSSLFSTLDDMIKWIQNFGSSKIAGEDVWQMMLKKGTLNDGQEINYGFGISFSNNSGITSYGHGGSWGGYLSEITFYPELRLVYVLNANRDPSGVYLNENILKLFMDNNEKETNDSLKKIINRTEVEIDQTLLKEYDGLYKSEYYIINAEKVGDHLVIHFPWGESYRVYPESNNRFFIKNSDLAFTFLRDKNDKVDRLIYNFKGTDMAPFHKLESDVSKYSDINGLCGDYTSHELQTTYTIKIKNDRLIVEHLQNENVQLVQIGIDNYIGDKWWFKDLKLIRDEKNSITGFKLCADDNNIQNLLFTKK